MDAQAAEQTLRELTEQAPTVAEADRHRLLSAVKKLASSLEKPEDAAFAQILIVGTFDLYIMDPSLI